MKRFDFPLERVRRWRSEQAHLEELRLQELRAELDRLGAAKRTIQAELAETELEVLAEKSLRAIDLESLDSYRFYVRGLVRDFELREKQCEAKVAEQRAKVIEARRRFELLDRLKGNAFSGWKAAVAKEQEDLAAELYLAKMSRAAR